MAKAAFQVPPISSMETSQVSCSEPPTWPAYIPQMRCHGLSLQDPQPSLDSFKLPSKMRGCVQGSMGRTGPQPWPLNPLGNGHRAWHPGVSTGAADCLAGPISRAGLATCSHFPTAPLSGLVPAFPMVSCVVQADPEAPSPPTGFIPTTSMKVLGSPWPPKGVSLSYTPPWWVSPSSLTPHMAIAGLCWVCLVSQARSQQILKL